MYTTMHYGRPSYTISNDNVKVFISVQGGHLTGSFAHSDKEIFPFFVGPWWKEALVEEVDPIMQVMRGDYFCFPFGADDVPYEGVTYPIHGNTANNCWDFIGIDNSGSEVSIKLSMDLDPDKGHVEKNITLHTGEPIIYQNNIISGFNGKAPFGNPPIIQCPDKLGAAIIDMTKPLTGFTAPTPIDVPENKGYSLLKPGVEITDRSKIPTVYGDYADLTHYPMSKGYEDVAMFINDPSKEFTFTSVSIPDEGFLYFQLKDPKVTAETLLWMPNSGRYYPPLNGRVIGVIAVEEVTGNFFYGRRQSVEANSLQDQGYTTCIDINDQSPFNVKLIMGLVPINKDFKGVTDVLRKNDSTVTIMGRGGEEIDVACKVDFLK